MESSSEDSFAWTDTSSDSFNSTSMAEDDTNENQGLQNDHRKKKKEKKYLSRTLSNDESENRELEVNINEEQSNSETKSNSSIRKDKIKLEPESDNDLPKKKKKIKQPETNGNQNDSQESMSYDEQYLNMKVKQEESSTSSSSKHKQKKHKQQSSTDSTTATKLKFKENHQINTSNEINEENVSEIEYDRELSISKKKKKKSKKRYDSDSDNVENEDKMDIAETVVNDQQPSNNLHKKHSKIYQTDSSIIENNTLQEESEESGCDEISAIKCDDDHNLHTISFINKSVEEENTKQNWNDSLNEITVSSQRKQAKKKVLEQDSLNNSESTKHRTQRISDRIRFEDDEDTNIESSQVQESDNENSTRSSKLKQFVKIYPSLKSITQQFHNYSNLTQDDEIWILKCPKEIDIKNFINTNLNVQEKCKIKVGGQTYDGSVEEEQAETISLLTMEHNKYKIRNLPLTGIINLRKRIPKAHFRDDNIMVNNQTNFIPLPEIKCRHPLFGSNYKKALKIPAEIAERLNAPDSEFPIKPEKRKKNKNKKNRMTSEHAQSEVTMKSEPELSIERIEKKKKKRKMVEDEGPAAKKVKRIKHDPESAEAWESEKAIEENLFNF